MGRLSLRLGVHLSPQAAYNGAVLPALGSLALSPTSGTQNSAITITILGATATSTLAVSAGALPTGLTLNSGARTITGTPTGSGTSAFTLRETLAGYSNSPRNTAFSFDIVASGGGGGADGQMDFSTATNSALLALLEDA